MTRVRLLYVCFCRLFKGKPDGLKFIYVAFCVFDTLVTHKSYYSVSHPV